MSSSSLPADLENILTNPGLLTPSTFADSLAKNSSLRAAQSRELQMFVKLAGNDVKRGDLLLRLAMQTTLFRVENALTNLVQKDNTNVEVLQDIKKIFGGAACLTDTDKATVLREVKDYLSGGTVACYALADVKVKARLTAKQQEYGLTHIFNNPARVQVLEAYIKECRRSILNQMRRVYKDAVANNTNHEEVARVIAQKFSADKYSPSPAFQGRVLVILEFARQLFTNETSGDDEDDDNDEDSTPGSQPSRKRKRTTRGGAGGSTGGRPSKGDAFWTQVDMHLRRLVEKYGNDLGSPEWKNFLLELSREENRRIILAIMPTPAFTNALQDITNIEEHPATPVTPLPNSSTSSSAVNTNTPNTELSSRIGHGSPFGPASPIPGYQQVPAQIPLASRTHPTPDTPHRFANKEPHSVSSTHAQSQTRGFFDMAMNPVPDSRYSSWSAGSTSASLPSYQADHGARSTVVPATWAPEEGPSSGSRSYAPQVRAGLAESFTSHNMTPHGPGAFERHD